MAYKFRLPDEETSREVLRLEEPTITLKWDPKRGERIRRVGGRPSVGSVDKLFPVLRELVSAFQKAGRVEFAVHLDADVDLTWDDVAWRDVVEVMDRCRAEGLDRFEFVPLLRRKAAKK